MMAHHPGVILVVLCLISASASTAAILHVPTDFPTIQSAIDAAAEGDEIHVSAGVYTGPDNKNLDFGGKNLTVIGMGGPETVVIDCENSGRGFHLHSGETSASSIIGFTIRNGLPYESGGGICCRGAAPLIRACIVEDCRGQYEGGGIYVSTWLPTAVEVCTVRRNQCFLGGDEPGDGGGIWTEGPVAIRHSIIEDNHGSSGAFGGGYGGGIYSEGGGSIEDCVIRHNVMLGHTGGGVYAVDATIARCRVVANFAAEYGGGLAIKGEMVVEDCLVAGNLCWTAGGGICAGFGLPAFISLSRCTIASNAVVQDQFPVFGGGGVVGRGVCQLEVIESVVWGNCAPEEGSAVYIMSGTTAYFTCSDIPVAETYSEGEVVVADDCIDADPLFCGPASCEESPTAAGDYTLASNSPCLPESSPCGLLIGVEGVGCDPPVPVVPTTWGGIKALYRIR